MTSDRYLFDRYTLELSSRQLSREKVNVPLSAKCFDTLVALVRRRGELASKDELISEVWPDTFVSEDSLTQSISMLRRILEDDPAQPRFIATVARRGYRFIAPIREEDPESEMFSPAERHAVALPSEPHKTAVLDTPRVENQPRAAKKAVPFAAYRIAVGMILGIAISVVYFQRPVINPAQRIRFVPDVQLGLTPVSGGTVSPDGRQMAFVARDDRSGESWLWLLSLSTSAARRLPGSEEALRPFWSPDGQSIAFFGGNKLRRIPVSGGPPVVICDTIAPRPSGGTWSEAGEILFGDSGGIYMVSSQGGVAKRILAPSVDRKELSVGWPQFLPGGRRYLLDVQGAATSLSGTYGASLDSKVTKKVVDSGAQHVAYASGYLMYVRERALVAQAFDPKTFSLKNEMPIPIDSVSQDASVSASAGNVIAYGGAATEELLWFDRSGHRIGSLNAPPPLRNLEFSPDGERLIAEGIQAANRGVWSIDLNRNVPTRIVQDGTYPMWSPDGKRVVFTATRESGRPGLYSRVIGSNDDQLLFSARSIPIVNDFTRDGRYIIYIESKLETKQDIWLLPQFGPRTPLLLMGSPAKEIHAQVSPDGRWIAYASDEEDSTLQVYVQAFPGLGKKRRVSSNGGAQPQWRADGKELYYLGPDQNLISVDVTSSAADIILGSPKSLFRTGIVGVTSEFRNQYAASGDGKRFVVATVSTSGSREPITLMVNWRAPAN